MDYQSFVDKDRVLLIAPAGYGKTYTIAECLKYTKGKQLILTHTHAGVASIRLKLKEMQISSDCYSVETISSFCQRYVHSFCPSHEIPRQGVNSKLDKNYHSFIVDKAHSIIGLSLVQKVINASYQGLFVDEYQDCSLAQHLVILSLSKLMPTRLLGDPLQGIFGFKDTLVDFETDLSNFESVAELQIPFRWRKKGNNSALGDIIKEFREPLSKSEAVTCEMNTEAGFYVIKVSEGDFNRKDSNYRKRLSSLIANKKSNPDFDNLLIITPEYMEEVSGKVIKKGGIKDRINILSKVDPSKSVNLLEAIDDNTFYSLSTQIDSCIASIKRSTKPKKKIFNILCSLFHKTSPVRTKNKGLRDWFSVQPSGSKEDFKVKNKQGGEKELSLKLSDTVSNFLDNPSSESFYNLLQFLRYDLNLRAVRRRDLMNSITKSLKDSFQQNISVHQAMLAHKNLIRRVGRKTEGKCIGTTFLTKGLEFDTVVILDAHKFDCPKNFYVALTRCCKNLVIFTASSTLFDR
ncbi:UvrD-helicase domain-containing protein [Vibrio natriegens]|uniref:UvrD-helicase domain-containing protein n=1 Tax=Vibrio natriegens TaxID=691 RepID=UPI002284B454|nr:UvrD-helicase domain-containing protein [Vibrio natriegens]ELA9308259.1 UvrD-helicase domain-containing protein [Vibrio parahaemolyticus]MCY9875371.1 UvrD-helicase domain-containing protein [Vibrio natriegens]